MEDTKIQAGPRDVFSQLLAVLGLYVVVFSFGSLIFSFINLAFPDVLRTYSYPREAVRFPLAVLIIVFPAYFWLEYRLQKDIADHPEKRGMKIRKWLLYFTLSVVAVVIAGDLVALIYQFLNGELTVRFLLKVLTVLLIAGSVFLYYTWNLRKNVMASRHPQMKFFVWGVVVVVLATVIGAFSVAGSPQSERLRRLDEQRTWDLQTLQSEVIEYWRTKEALPQTLEVLRDDIRGFVPPRDPKTGEAYGYQRKGDLTFELCANFETVSNTDGQSIARPIYDGIDSQANWAHGTGVVCFLRTIDPDRFPPIKQQ